MRLLKLKLVLAILLFAFTINAQDIILEEGFNTGSIPTGWTEAFETGSYEAHWEPGHVGGTNDFPAYTHSGDYNLKALKYTSSTTSTCRITTPSMDLSSYNHVAFEFYASAGQNSIYMDDFDVYYKTSAGGTWQPLIQEWTAAPDWTKFTFVIPDGDLTDDFYISWVANVTMAWITLDDVRVYEYFETPTVLTATSNTNSVDLSWTGVSQTGFSNYKIYRNGTEVGTTANTTYTDNSVTQNTAYDYYVTAIYGSDESEATNIAPAAPDGILTPYTQDFENAGNRPTAWSNTWKTPYNHYSAEDFDFPFHYNDGGLGDEDGAPLPSSAYEGSYCTTVRMPELWLGLETMLITPMFNLTDNDASVVTFQLYNQNRGTYIDELKIYYKNTLGGEWTELVHLTDAYNSWTTMSYALPNTSATYWIGFEAITNSGFGITIDNVEILENLAGTVVGGADICGIGQIPELTLQGYSGTIVKWQKRVDEGSWTDIVNTNDTYQETASSLGTWDYRAVVQNAGTDYYSGYTTVFVATPSDGGEASNSTACLEDGTGVTLDFSYNQDPVGEVIAWQISDEGQNNWSDIEGAAGYPYQYYPDFHGEYDIRAKVQNGDACAVVYSEIAWIKLANNDAELTGPTLVCSGSTANLEITPISAPTFYTYEWEKSTAPFTSWTDLSNNGNHTFTTAAITEETHYRVRVRSFPCDTRYIELTVEVGDDISGGNITGTTELCTGSTTDLTLINHAGNIQEWQYLESPYTGDWTTIANTTINYTTEILTISTKYRAIVTQGTCDPAYSEELEVIVSENTVAGTLTADNTEICINSSTGDITLTGNTGDITKWQKNLDGAAWTNITSTINPYSEVPTEAGTWNYRVEVQNGVCDAAFSPEVSIIVNNTSVEPGTLTGGTAEICLGTETGEMSITGNEGTITQWQKKLNEDDWQNIANTTNTHNETPTETGTWKFRVETDASGCGLVYSNEVEINVLNSDFAGTLTCENTEICLGASTGNIHLNDFEGTINKWQSRVDAGNWTDEENTTENFSTTPDTEGTWEYRVEITNAVCGTNYCEPYAITVGSGISASFTSESDGLTVTFTNTSVNTDSYHWWFGDDSESTDENPVHTYDQAGTYTVTFKAISSNCNLNEEITAEVTVTEAAGIGDIESININIYPNPANNFVNIKAENTISNIRIYNYLGQQVIQVNKNTNIAKIDVSSLNSGVYILKIDTKEGSFMKKLIIQ